MKKKKKILLVSAGSVLVLATAGIITAAVPAEYDEFSEESRNTESRIYDRERVREYARAAAEDPESTQFRYLDISNGDNATDCANYVSQCLWAGGYEMNDGWYMKKYSSSVPKIKRIADKVKTFARARLYEEFNVGKELDLYYTDMNYIWTNSWACAGVQLKYGEQKFFDGVTEVSDFSELKNAVSELNIQTGDIIYQSPGNIHHVVIVSDVDDEGNICIASHNPPLFDEKLDEEAWARRGFSGGAVIYKVSDKIS